MSDQAGKENTEPDNINVGLVATVTVVGALLVVAIAAALTALVRSESSSYGNEVGAYANLGTVKRLKEEQRGKLEASPSWSDQSKGLVSVPIDRAMGLVTADIQKNPYLATPSPPKPKEEPDAAAAAADGGAPAAPAASATEPAKPQEKDGKQPASDKAAAPAPEKAPEKEKAPAPAPAAPASGAPEQK